MGSFFERLNRGDGDGMLVGVLSSVLRFRRGIGLGVTFFATYFGFEGDFFGDVLGVSFDLFDLGVRREKIFRMSASCGATY